MRVVHIASGDKWAGAEVQLLTLASNQALTDDVYVVLLNAGELEQRLIQKGIDVTVFDETQFSFADLFHKIRRHLKQLRPHVVHTHRQKENILGSLASFLVQGAVCVRTVHGALEFKRNWKQTIQHKLDIFCGRWLQSAVIAVSSDLANKLSHDFKPSHIHVIENGIDPYEVQQTTSLKNLNLVTLGEFNIGFVGRVEPVKRIDLFLAVAERLVGENKCDSVYRFHVFGDGSELPTAKKKTAELGIQESVEFYGHRSDIVACMAKMDAVLMPSDHEGLPMTALECCALGVPIVAHRTGGLVNLLTANFPIGLVAEHNVDAYAERLLDVLQQQTKPLFNMQYSAKNNALSMLKLYKQLLSK